MHSASSIEAKTQNSDVPWRLSGHSIDSLDWIVFFYRVILGWDLVVGVDANQQDHDDEKDGWGTRDVHLRRAGSTISNPKRDDGFSACRVCLSMSACLVSVAAGSAVADVLSEKTIVTIKLLFDSCRSSHDKHRPSC